MSIPRTKASIVLSLKTVLSSTAKENHSELATLILNLSLLLSERA
jgi:hypothetical protein